MKARALAAVCGALAAPALLPGLDSAAAQNGPPPAITLTADRTDVLLREKVVLSGRVDPPP